MISFAVISTAAVISQIFEVQSNIFMRNPLKANGYETPKDSIAMQLDKLLSDAERQEKSSNKLLRHRNHSSEAVITKSLYRPGFEYPHQELCPNHGQNMLLLVLIDSKASHYSKRNAIRASWGKFSDRQTISIAFVMSQLAKEHVKPIANEDAVYQDIIITRNIDFYYASTLKTLSMLEWTATYCPKVSKLLKTNEKVFVNILKLFQLFVFKTERATANYTIWGNVKAYEFPVRDQSSKLYVPNEQYSERKYPRYCNGLTYLMTSDVIQPLFTTGLNQKYIHLEEVFVTGILAKLLLITRVNIKEFYNKKVTLSDQKVETGLSIYGVTEFEQYNLFKMVLNDECTKSYPGYKL